MNVVVTGSTSFLGAALIRKLLGRGCRVYAVVRPGSRNLAALTEAAGKEGFGYLTIIELELEKPWAPIGLHLETVSVAIRRKWHTVYIALGSNMGDRERYLQTAVESIGKKEGCQVEKVSSFVRTAPYGGVEQEDFLNGCMQIRTLLTPRELLEFLQEIEKQAGRERKIHWGPRTLDLDIIFYDREVIEEEDLQIPHVEMQKRDFVLIPLREIAPFLRHPITGKTVGEMAEELVQRYVM